MNESEARARVAALVRPEAMVALERFAERIVAEAQEQNLVSASSITALWSRHILDSVQLLSLAPPGGSWLDIGSGAGFPGMVVALCSDRSVTLCEPRTKRADLLTRLAAEFERANVRVYAGKVERIPSGAPFAVISARAVASLPTLFAIAHRHADTSTLWLLPKGRSATAELAQATASWRGTFHVEQSITDPEAAIVVARGVKPR